MAADPTAKMQRIELNSLGVEQLSQLSKQLETELAFFTESMNELRTVASKFGRCQAALNSMKAEEKDKPALIPLSESVYIKARVPDQDKYLVEIGTGYFVEMSREKASEYFKRKFLFVEAQAETIRQKLLPEKQQVRQFVLEALQKKIQEMTIRPST